jgi:hypothetical protein
MDNTYNTVLKANILGGMDTYIRDVIGDEDIFMRWSVVGVPDGCDEEELMEIAEDDDEFLRICNVWDNLIREER